GQRFEVIRGTVPPVGGFPSGCRFRNRCDWANERCMSEPATETLANGHRFKCWNPAVQRENAA
ncbi:MAG: ABC transporter ATP-binding protein, partial [Propionibacteriaceae bacterium]|nr:ABC transporter ATP-binding protein [Propionibacteriaceae bacterium]